MPGRGSGAGTLTRGEMASDNAQPGQATIWHFAGDVFEWLESRPHVSGVQRVALQLMAAGCGPSPAGPHDGICVLAPSGRWLGPVPANEALAAFEPWLTPGEAPGEASREAPRKAHDTRLRRRLTYGSRPDALLWPGPGEHVLFAGLVWTPRYMGLFSRLSAFGLRFSVLVHDIIPLQRPDLVAAGEPARFSDWLRVVLVTADIVFVSTHVTRNAMIAWARRSGVVAKSRICVIPFGSSHLAGLKGALVKRPAAAPGDAAGFVLSVGTIDRRKNQAILLRVWSRLIGQLGGPALPALILAGRPNLPDFDEAARPLKAAGKLVVLDQATDGELAWLYRNCRFTIFPSLCEGYGLPVAESLAFGKLSVASDLAEVREIAGDAIWICDCRSELQVAACVRRGIEDEAGRAAVERQLKARAPVPSWDDSLAAVRHAAQECERGPLAA
jgi:glycosyltransferase involved in cell wall biosynthesis